MSETSEIIKELRAMNLSQSEISRRTGIPQPRISRWEGGDVPTGADDAMKLSRLIAAMRRKSKRVAAKGVTNA